MPGWRRSLSAALVLLALLPAAAAGQSAGDEQYEDPFGEQQTQSEAPPAATPAPAAEPAPATATPAPAAPVQPATQSSAQPAAAELPRTGANAWLPGLLGAALLSAGVALRAHARRDR